MKTPTYGLVGRGRLASHMAHYLGLEGHDVVVWHRDLKIGPEEHLRDTDVILLAISDRAIAGFLDRHPDFGNHMVVHFSGAQIVEGAHGLHPLMTFGPELYPQETYRSIPFVTESGGAGFHEIFPGLQNPSWSIDPDDKPLYHALCVLAGNVTTILWAKAMGDFEHRLGLPGDILRPYLRQSAVNSLDRGMGSLTGPFARGDRNTIDLDLEGLRGDPFREVYVALAKTFDPLEANS